MLKLNDSHDIFIDNFSFVQLDTKTDDLSQRIKVKLLTVKGEWEFDLNYGIPYYTDIFVKNVSKDYIDGIFKTAIQEERDVDKLLSYYSIIDSTTRTFKIAAEARRTDGDTVTINVTL